VIDLTLVIPYFDQPQMLLRQVEEIEKYNGVRVIVVDDCSPIKASDVIRGALCSLYRIDTDIPWNRGGARNLGSMQAETEWLIHVDIDHVLPAECLERLLEYPASENHWYRFPRFRVGTADETRKKDDLDPDCEFGPIKPHIDSYLIRRDLFLKSPYDEDYSGCLGGGSPFLDRMQRIKPVRVLPADIYLEVYTRDKIPDASVVTLNRDTSEYKRRRKLKEKTGKVKPKNPLRFKWHRVW
jgi:glycosyltransferase involved in cell wall biosynthesis